MCEGNWKGQTSDLRTGAAATTTTITIVRRASEDSASRNKIKALKKIEKSRDPVFLMFWGSGGLKSRFAKAAGAELSVGMENEKRRTAAKHISKSKCSKHPSVGAFWDVELFEKTPSCGTKRVHKSKC